MGRRGEEEEMWGQGEEGKRRLGDEEKRDEETRGRGDEKRGQGEEG